MARLWSSGFESNPTAGNVVEWDQAFQSQAAQSSVVRSGAYSGQSTSLSSGSAQYYGYRFVAANADGPYFFRVYLNISTNPSAQNRILALLSSTSVQLVYITLDSGGLLRLFDEDGQIGSASSALSAGTWYRIEIKYDRTAAAGSHIVEAKIDGIAFATSSTRSLSVGIRDIRIGANINSEAQTTGTWYWDDVAINDATGSFQTSYPDEGKIIHLRPSAAGDNTTWTPDTGSNFARVNEVLSDGDTSYVRNSTTLNNADDYNTDDSGIASYDTVTLVAVGYRARGETSTSNQYQFTVRAKKTSAGTISESASQNLASTSFLTNAPTAPRNYPLTLYQDPDAASWTQSTLDSMQIGLKTSVTSTNRVRVSTLWALVEYVPGTPPAIGDITYMPYVPPFLR